MILAAVERKCRDDIVQISVPWKSPPLNQSRLDLTSLGTGEAEEKHGRGVVRRETWPWRR